MAAKISFGNFFFIFSFACRTRQICFLMYQNCLQIKMKQKVEILIKLMEFGMLEITSCTSCHVVDLRNRPGCATKPDEGTVEG